MKKILELWYVPAAEVIGLDVDDLADLVPEATVVEGPHPDGSFTLMLQPDCGHEIQARLAERLRRPYDADPDESEG